MIDQILTYEGTLRFLFFIGVLTVMTSWEILAPRRIFATPKGPRWYSNLGLVFLDTFALRVLLPMQAVGMGEIA